jgi:hypothetical protein
VAEWRAGRSTGRTLWRVEVLVGMVDSPEIAAVIVEAMNRVGALDTFQAGQRQRLLEEVRRAPEGDCADGCTRHATCRPGTERERSHPVGPSRTGEQFAALLAIVDRHAGREHSADGSVATALREVLVQHEAMLRQESGRERSPEPAECGCPITLETARVTRHSRECSVRQAAERFEAGIEDERPAECCCAGCIGMGPCDDDLGKSDGTECDHPWHDGEDDTSDMTCPRCGELYAWSCCGSTDPEHLPSRCGTKGGVTGGA